MIEVLLALCVGMMFWSSYQYGNTIYGVNFSYFIFWQALVILPVLFMHVPGHFGCPMPQSAPHVHAALKVLLACSSLFSSIYSIKLLRESLNWADKDGIS